MKEKERRMQIRSWNLSLQDCLTAAVWPWLCRKAIMPHGAYNNTTVQYVGAVGILKDLT